MSYLERNIAKLLEETIGSRPLVYLNGPRQVGKSTLTHNIKTKKEINYITFDSPLILASVKSDPVSFMKSLPQDKLNIIDEVQMAPEIFPYLKMSIDEKRLEGKSSCLYLLTGSANLLALPKLSDALVGRMSVLTLLPFSTAEQSSENVNFIEKLFNEELGYRKYKEKDIIELIKNSTYPEIAVNKSINRNQWFDDYLTTILQRDVQTVADIRNPEKIVMMLSVLSQRAAGLINNTEVSNEIGLDNKTYDKYKASAINTFLIFEIKPWAKPNKINKRFTKSPKLFFTDTNMLTYIMKRDIEEIYVKDKSVFGHLFENFIATEIMKNTSALSDVEVSHFRTSDNKEVDFVLEKHNGDIVGIEVKLSGTVNTNDIKGLNVLKEVVGERFKKGIVIYTGNEIVPLGEDIWAVPIQYLY
ncbi:MAG: ATP-binding protein [Alphaproteobacteria bacterium]|nr:ATP-binding protein [Alphaproteobacteria bacterium]